MPDREDEIRHQNYTAISQLLFYAGKVSAYISFWQYNCLEVLAANFKWVQTRVISGSGLRRKDQFWEGGSFNFRLLRYQFCWNGTIIACFLSHTEDKVAWTFKGSNLDWPCPVNGWPATAANEAVCRRWVWDDWSIYYSSPKLHIYIWFICSFICLHEVSGNYWRQDNSSLNHFLPPICCTHCMSMIE